MERKLKIYYLFSLALTIGGPVLFFSFLILATRGSGVGGGGFGVGLLFDNMMTVFYIFFINSLLASAVMVLILKKREPLYIAPFFIHSAIFFIYISYIVITKATEYTKHKNRNMAEIARQCDFEELDRRLSKPINWNKDEDGRKNSIYNLLNCNNVTTAQILRLHESGAIVGSKELFSASEIVRPDILSELIKLGVNVNDRNPDGITALMMTHDSDTAKILIKAGADVNAVDNRGRTALMYSRNGHITKALLKAGANHLVVDNERNNALHFATRGNFDLANDDDITIKLLVDAGVDVNHVNNNGETPLMYSIGASNTEWLFPIFIQHGVKINLVDKNGRTALHYSTQSRCLEVFSDCWASILIEAGADVNRPDKDGNTPLHEAALADASNVMKRLRIAGVDINKKNNKGQTPLDLVKEKLGDNYKESHAYKILTQDIEQLRKETKTGG
jgi:ankyrin repeat protein